MALVSPQIDLAPHIRDRLRSLHRESNERVKLLEHSPGRYSISGDTGGAFDGSLLTIDGRRVDSAVSLPDGTEVWLQTVGGGMAGKGQVVAGEVRMYPEGQQHDPFADVIQGGANMIGSLSGVLGRITGFESLKEYGEAQRELGAQAEDQRPLGDKLNRRNRLSMGFRAKDAGQLIAGSLPFLAGFRAMAVAGSLAARGVMLGRGKAVAPYLGAAVANSGLNASVVADEIRVEMQRAGYSQEEIGRAMRNAAFQAGAVSAFTGGILGGRAFGRNRAALEGSTEAVEEVSQADAIWRHGFGEDYDWSEVARAGFLGGFGSSILLDKSSRVVGPTPLERGLNDYRQRSVQLRRFAARVPGFKGTYDVPLAERQAQAARGEKVEETAEKDAVEMVRSLAGWSGRETEVMQMTDKEVRVSFGKYFPESDYTPDQIKGAVLELAGMATKFDKVSDEALRADFERGDLAVFGLADEGDHDAIAMVSEARSLAKKRGEKVLPRASRMLMDSDVYANEQARLLNEAFISPFDEWTDRRMARSIMEIFPEAHPHAQPVTGDDKAVQDGVIGANYASMKPRPPLRHAPMDGAQALRAVRENVPFDRIVARADRLMDAIGRLEDGDDQRSGLDLLTSGPRPVIDPMEVALFLADHPGMAARVALASRNSAVSTAGKAAVQALGTLAARRRTAVSEIQNMRMLTSDPKAFVKSTSKLLGDLKDIDDEAKAAQDGLWNALGADLDHNLRRSLMGIRGQMLDMAAGGRGPREMAEFGDHSRRESVYGPVDADLVSGPGRRRAASALWSIADLLVAEQADQSDVDDRIWPDVNAALMARGVVGLTPVATPAEEEAKEKAEEKKADETPGEGGIQAAAAPEADPERDGLMERTEAELDRVVMEVLRHTAGDDAETVKRALGLGMSLALDRIARSRLATEKDDPEAVGKELRSSLEKAAKLKLEAATPPGADAQAEPSRAPIEGFAEQPRDVRDFTVAMAGQLPHLVDPVHREHRLARTFTELGLLLRDRAKPALAKFMVGEWVATVDKKEMGETVEPALREMLTWYGGPGGIVRPSFPVEVRAAVEWMRDETNEAYRSPLQRKGGPLSVEALDAAVPALPSPEKEEGDKPAEETTTDLVFNDKQIAAIDVGLRLLDDEGMVETARDVIGGMATQGDKKTVIVPATKEQTQAFGQLLVAMYDRMGPLVSQKAMADHAKEIEGLIGEVGVKVQNWGKTVPAAGDTAFAGQASERGGVVPGTVRAYQAGERAGRTAERIKGIVEKLSPAAQARQTRRQAAAGEARIPEGIFPRPAAGQVAGGTPEEPAATTATTPPAAEGEPDVAPLPGTPIEGKAEDVPQAFAGAHMLSERDDFYSRRVEIPAEVVDVLKKALGGQVEAHPDIPNDTESMISRYFSGLAGPVSVLDRQILTDLLGTAPEGEARTYYLTRPGAEKFLRLLTTRKVRQSHLHPRMDWQSLRAKDMVPASVLHFMMIDQMPLGLTNEEIQTVRAFAEGLKASIESVPPDLESASKRRTLYSERGRIARLSETPSEPLPGVSEVDTMETSFQAKEKAVRMEGDDFYAAYHRFSFGGGEAISTVLSMHPKGRAKTFLDRHYGSAKANQLREWGWRGLKKSRKNAVLMERARMSELLPLLIDDMADIKVAHGRMTEAMWGEGFTKPKSIDGIKWRAKQDRNWEDGKTGLSWTEKMLAEEVAAMRETLDQYPPIDVRRSRSRPGPQPTQAELDPARAAAAAQAKLPDKPTEPDGAVDRYDPKDDFYAVTVRLSAAAVDGVRMAVKRLKNSEVASRWGELAESMTPGKEFSMFIDRAQARLLEGPMRLNAEEMDRRVTEGKAIWEKTAKLGLVSGFWEAVTTMEEAVGNAAGRDITRSRKEWLDANEAEGESGVITTGEGEVVTEETTTEPEETKDRHAERKDFTPYQGEEGPQSAIGKVIDELPKDADVDAAVSALAQAALTEEGLDQSPPGVGSIVRELNKVDSVFALKGAGEPVRASPVFTAIMSSVAALDEVVPVRGPQNEDELWALLQSGELDPLGRTADKMGVSRDKFDEALAKAVDMNWILKERGGHTAHVAVAYAVQNAVGDDGWGLFTGVADTSNIGPATRLEQTVIKLGMSEYRRGQLPRDPRGRACRAK